MLQAGRSRVRLPMNSFDFLFHVPKPFRRSIVVGLTQPLIKISTRNVIGVKERPEREACQLHCRL
jgi:hypothetical protein